MSQTNSQNISIDTYSQDKEYLDHFDFIMENSAHIPIDFIKISESVINRKEIIKKIDDIINCYNISEDIEKGIFESSLNYVISNNYPYHFFHMTYHDKLENLLVNLDDKNEQVQNKTLINDILTNKLSGQIIAFLHPYQLHPQRWKSIIDKNNLRDDTLSKVNTTDEFKCMRCGEKKHTYYITQTRCIDEPATIFYTCTVCRKTFKKSM